MPSSGMRAIVKQILKLHETLASVFQEEQMEVTSFIRDLAFSLLDSFNIVYGNSHCFSCGLTQLPAYFLQLC